MKFGLFGGITADRDPSIRDEDAYADYADYVCEAEDLGYHSIFLVEHHFTGVGHFSSSPTFLAYLAARTSRMRLGTAVVVLPWHNPVLLAEQIATLDVLSRGRFDFGIGRGYRHTEFHGFNIPMDEANSRYQETLDFIRKAWTSEGRFSHDGPHWHFRDVLIEPVPAQRPHPPLWIGAHSDNSVRSAAENGFNLLLSQVGSPDQIGHSLSVYREALEAKQRPYDPAKVGLTRGLHLVSTKAEREAAIELRLSFLRDVQRLAKEPAAKQQSDFLKYDSAAEMRKATEIEALIGTPDEIIGRLHNYRKAGVEYVLLMDVGQSRAVLRRFAREVMPEFRDRRIRGHGRLSDDHR